MICNVYCIVIRQGEKNPIFSRATGSLFRRQTKQHTALIKHICYIFRRQHQYTMASLLWGESMGSSLQIILKLLKMSKVKKCNMLQTDGKDVKNLSLFDLVISLFQVKGLQYWMCQNLSVVFLTEKKSKFFFRYCDWHLLSLL